MLSFLTKLLGSRWNRASKPIRQTFRPHLEVLEDRLAMSTLNFASSGAALLTYTGGTNVSNHVSISLNSSNNYVIEDTAETITLQGVTSGVTISADHHSVVVPHDRVASMFFSLNDGGDFLKVLASDHPITVDGGAGNEVFQVGDNGFSLDRIHAQLTLIGANQEAGGMDVVNIIDGTTTGQKFWSIQNNLVNRTSTGLISYSGLERVAIAAGKGDDVIDVLSTSAATFVSGGDGNDLFRLGTVGSVGNIQNLLGAVNLTGGAGSDWLDYRAFSTPVRVYLDGGLATGAAGITNFENVFGGGGDDDIHGNSQNNILVGNGGNDSLVGNEGRDILIGGLGVDHLYGGSGEDILIGDKSPWDGSHTALQAVMNEWASTAAVQTRPAIAAASYEARIAHITGQTTGGLNGSYYLNFANVQGDGAVDFLYGEGDRDWFFATTSNPQQEAIDRIPATERNL